MAKKNETPDRDHCGICTRGEAVEGGAIYCPVEKGPVNLSDWCEDFRPKKEVSVKMPSRRKIEAAVKEALAPGVVVNMPRPVKTADLRLFDFEGIKEEFDRCRDEISEYLQNGGAGDPSLTLKFTDWRRWVDATIEVNLPKKIKRKLGSQEVIRENGTIRRIIPDQPELFDSAGAATKEAGA